MPTPTENFDPSLLTGEPKRKPNPNADSMELLSLRQTVEFMNNPEISGAQVPTEIKSEIAHILTPPRNKAPATLEESLTGKKTVEAAIPGATIDPSQKEKPQGTVVVKSAAPMTPIKPLANKIFFTGKLSVGKDYLANLIQSKIFGFADPIYYLASYFFGVNVTATENKDLPGMRRFLQIIGQWGRGTVNAEYPFDATRALFLREIRALYVSGLVTGYGVEWEEFGKKDSLWLDACLRRVAAYDSSGGRVSITNVRFENEYTRLIKEGWQSWHVIAGPDTWAQRLAKKGLNSFDPPLSDISEKLSRQLDNQVVQTISQQRDGAKLRVVWNDPNMPAPSPRLHTIDEFVRASQT